MRQNKYSNLKSKSVIPLVPRDLTPVLFFRQPNGRSQKIDLSFLAEGKYPRPQIADACVGVFWLEMQRYSSPSREKFRDSLRVFNKFLNWRAEGGVGRYVSTTLEIKSELFVEFSAYLELLHKSSSAHGTYHAAARFFKIMQSVRPEYLCSDLAVGLEYRPLFLLGSCDYSPHTYSFSGLQK